MSKFAVYCIADVSTPPLILSRRANKGAFFGHLPVPIVDQLVIFSEGEWEDAGTDFEVTLTYKDDEVMLGYITKSCRCLLWKKSSITLPNSMTSSLENGLAKLVVDPSEGPPVIVRFDGQSGLSSNDIVMKELNENTLKAIHVSKTTRARSQKIKRHSSLYKEDVVPSMPSLKKQKVDSDHTVIKPYGSKPSKTLSKILEKDNVSQVDSPTQKTNLDVQSIDECSHASNLMRRQPKPYLSAKTLLDNQLESYNLPTHTKLNKESQSKTNVSRSEKLTIDKNKRSNRAPVQSLNEVSRLKIKKMAAQSLKKVEHSKLASAQILELKSPNQLKQDNSSLHKHKNTDTANTNNSSTHNSKSSPTRPSLRGNTESKTKSGNLVNKNNSFDSYSQTIEEVIKNSIKTDKKTKRRGMAATKKDSSVTRTGTSVTDKNNTSLLHRTDSSCQADNTRKAKRARKSTKKAGILPENDQESVYKEIVNCNISAMDTDLDSNSKIIAIVMSKMRECVPEMKKVSSCKDITLRAMDRPSGRWGHSLCFIHKNMSVMIGGQGEKQQLNKDSVWTLDTETRRWKNPSTQSEGQKPDFRMGHTATYDPIVRCIYVYGGSKNTRWFHDVHVLDIEEWKWQLVKVSGKAPTLAYHSATLYRHELWIFGGVYPKPASQPDGCSNEMHIFSPIMKSWYSPIVSGEKPIPRSGHSATLVADKMIVFGGWDAPISYSDLHILDMSIVEWTQPLIIGVPPIPRSWHASCALSGNRMLIHGGYNGDFALGDSHIFNLDQLNWCQIQIENSPSARVGHKAICLPYRHDNEEEDEIIIFGGGDNNGGYFDDLYSIYVPFEAAVVSVSNI